MFMFKYKLQLKKSYINRFVALNVRYHVDLVSNITGFPNMKWFMCYKTSFVA